MSKKSSEEVGPDEGFDVLKEFIKKDEERLRKRREYNREYYQRTKVERKKKRYGVKVTGVCRICGETGETQMHHIISQARCKKIGKPELIKNPGNIVELCMKHHDLTPASLRVKRDKVIQGHGLDHLHMEVGMHVKGGYIAEGEPHLVESIMIEDWDPATGKQWEEQIDIYTQKVIMRGWAEWSKIYGGGRTSGGYGRDGYIGHSDSTAES